MQNIEEIINEANKCLNCKNPMCKKGCPIQTNIPEFINEIKNNNLIKAYEILQEKNIMSYICSNVCPYEEYCEGHCIKGIKENPVKIHMLEKYVNYWARENNIKYKYKIKEKNDIKIAIIGSGPAGIACAIELIKEGFNVTIFEKEEFIGGLLTYGIPGFRLPRNITYILEEKLKELNIEIKTNMEFGKDITIKSLKREGYKSIFIGIGAEVSQSYSITKKDNKNIFKSDYILKEYNAKKIIENLGHTIIIGGGNVATDSARAAIRMGAKSATIIYRRSKEKMPARQIELQEAIKDGVKIIYNAKVIEAITNERDKIEKIKCIKTIQSDEKLKDVENSEFYLEANSVIFAMGLKPNKSILEKEKIEIENNLIKINEKNETNIKGVFAGGDDMQSKATVCKAIYEGKKAAKEMSHWGRFPTGHFVPLGTDDEN